ncbi:MAG TPA: endolytic transglycosylase MltG [Candidatus Saccharimonadales bacterium]|jgi:UPF0755 protein
MKKYKANRSSRARRLRRVFIALGIVVVIIVVAAIAVRRVYYDNLLPVSSRSTVSLFTITSGESSTNIAKSLQTAKLIRSNEVFEWYVSSQNVRSELQAGTYVLRPSMSVPDIVNIFVKGEIATNYVTILPGKRIDQIRDGFVKAGFKSADVTAALNARNYAGNPTLVDNPARASLEGFLYPDSFQKNANTKPQVIVQESLAEMAKALTPNIRAAFAREGLSVYQGVTLASIVEQEVSNDNDRAQAAQVFLKRLHTDMPLGSDVTAFYGAIQAGQKPSTTYDSPYNTLVHKGLPPGPISNVSASSLNAVAHPANTDWLYFVTGDNGNTYFSKTYAQHQSYTQQYCHKLCSGTE